ncbi:MAG: hypothetical protein L7S56_05565 [Candidatus Poseidonia sp.]|nr:hypothetical protein [Poseidonia sp.]
MASSSSQVNVHPIQWGVIVVVVSAGIIPLLLGVLRLMQVTQASPIDAILHAFDTPLATEALQFTLLEAALSTLLTLLIGIPLAWSLGRYEWRGIRGMRAFLFVPFVTPPIVAAAGFLALYSSGGLLPFMGLDLRTETGVIQWFSELSGWAHPGHMLALVLAHAWFNLSLVVRFLEPTLAQMNPHWEEQLLLLPGGQSWWLRVRHLWWPVLGPSLLVAATYTFFFSFTSFALVKWLVPGANTVESLLGELGGSAGIAFYRTEASLLVLGLALIQGAFMLIILTGASKFENQHTKMLALHDEQANRKLRGNAPRIQRWYVFAIITITSLPFLSVLIASFRKRAMLEDGTQGWTWTLDGWRQVYQGDASTITLLEALGNSLTFALLTLLIALPTGYALASAFHRLERQGKRKLANSLDIMCMVPLSASAVMIGLGIVVGLLQWFPSMFQFQYLPVLPHVMLILPFTVRIFRPAFTRLDPMYEEQIELLNLPLFRAWWHGKGAFLVGPFAIATSLCLAFSLGEFGATYLMVRVGSWDSLSIMVDQLLSRPKFDPLVMPTAMAAATTLMVVTFTALLVCEFVRKSTGGTDDV